MAKSLKRSRRGELEITDVNMDYLGRGELSIRKLGGCLGWLDAGTTTGLHEASLEVQPAEKRDGVKIGCPEEAAFRRGLLSLGQLESSAAKMPNREYRDYIVGLVAHCRRTQPGAPT